MHDDFIDSLRHCAFIQGRCCGKTMLARQLLNSNYGLASADNWAQRHLYNITDKLYDTLGIKEYLNKVYGNPTLKFKNGDYIRWDDIDLTNSDKLKELFKAPDIVDLVNQIKKEEEKNNMANQKQVYTFKTVDYEGKFREITLEKDFKNNEYPYHARVYTIKDKDDDGKFFTLTFGYHYWEQLETQLMYDLASSGIVIVKDRRDEVTHELHRAKNVFRGCSYANFESPYQGGYAYDSSKSLKKWEKELGLTGKFPTSLPWERDNVCLEKPFQAMPKIEKVIFNPPATIVKWKDGTKTVVKCQDDDEFDWEKGLAMAYVKRAFNNERTYYGLFKKNEPWMNLPNSNVRYDPKVAKEVRIIVPKNLPVTGDIIMKAHELIMKECDKKAENGIELDR